ncbi:hypothetical protein A2U01_0089788, partial [Trifolium medium]|nr:hypothetical protein [Trifolium medium]
VEIVRDLALELMKSEFWLLLCSWYGAQGWTARGATCVLVKLLLLDVARSAA